MTLAELRQKMASGPEPSWWSFRFLEAVVKAHDNAIEEDKRAAVEAFVRLAVADPEWAIGKLTEGGPVETGLARLLSGPRLALALGRIELPSVKQDALLRACMLLASANWPPEGRSEEEQRGL